MLKHNPSPKNPTRVNLVNKAIARYKIDGLNNLKYKLNGIVKYPLFTHLQIDVGESSWWLINAITTIIISYHKDKFYLMYSLKTYISKI